MFGSGYKNLLLIGKKENLEIVKWLREMLSERFVEISNEKWKEYRKTAEYLLQPISKDRFQRGFLMGCVAGIDEKMKEIAERDKREDEVYSSKVTALTLRNNTDIDEFIANKYSKVKYTKNRAVAGTASARNMGYKVGKNTDIYNQ